MKLNLGCGRKHRKGWVNVDNNEGNKPQIVHNLNKFPYPFKDDSVTYIVMDAVLEHLDDPIKVLEECHRILKPKCILEIQVPHYSSPQALTHPQHKHAFNIGCFNMFTKNSQEKYTDCEYEIVSTKIEFYSMWGNPRKLLTRVINSSNKLKTLYTFSFLSYLIPLANIRIRLKKISS